MMYLTLSVAERRQFQKRYLMFQTTQINCVYISPMQAAIGKPDVSTSSKLTPEVSSVRQFSQNEYITA